MSAFRDPEDFDFVAELEAEFEPILAELRALAPSEFVESPDSLTAVANGYDETGWRYFALYGEGGGLEANRARCPHTAKVCSRIAGLVNAGFSSFLPGTHLYPHRGERLGELRCHLALVVPEGDVALRFGAETRAWVAGRCLIFDDTLEHEAWNHGVAERVVLIVTFTADAAR